MAQVTQGDTPLEGNTSTSSVVDIKSRRWIFVINNYTNEMFDTLTRTFKEKKWIYVMGKEVGEKGTPHIQGYLEAKNAIRFNTLKKMMPTAHIEKAKGTREDNLTYCSKEGQAERTIPKSLKEQYDEYMQTIYKDIKWHDWQQNVLDLLKTKANRRTIHWFWETKGNVGKSFITAYIEWKYKCIIINGKQADIFNGIKTYLDTEKTFPEVVIVDIPRTNEKYVCYSTIEKIKDGIMYSGKYEGGTIRLLPVHMIIFANFPPIESNISEDRWNITEL